MTRTRFLVALIGGIGALVLAFRCDPWGDGDTGFPVLDPHGTVRVEPCGYTFGASSLDADGGAIPASFVVEATSSAGIGAAGVPVDIAVGPCPTGDAGAGASTGAEAEAGACPPPASIQVDPARFGDLALTTAEPDAGACSVVTPNALACVLSPDGTFAFNVAPRAPLMTTNGAYIPICVSVRGSNTTQLIPISIASPVTGATLNTYVAGTQQLTIPPVTLANPDGGSCADLIGNASCTVSRAALPAAVQLNLDGGLLVAQQPIDLVLAITPPEAFSLSTNADCSATQGEIDRSMAAGTSIVNGFFVCGGPGNAAPGQYALQVATSDTSLATGPARVDVVAQPASVTAAALNEDAGTAVLVIRDCKSAPIPGVSLHIMGDAGASIAYVSDDAGFVNIPFSPSGAAQLVQLTIDSSKQTCSVSLQ